MPRSLALPRKLSAIVLTASCLLASSQLAAQFDPDYVPPKTIDGTADLQGVWENNTITPVERPAVFGDKQFLTDEDVVFLEQRLEEIYAAGEDALFGGGVLEAAFSGEIQSYDPSTGNYDSQWMAERTIHRRTSQIIDPPNGQFPPRTEAAIAAARELREHREAHPADSWTDRPLGERCLSFGAPRLGSGYNSYWQIVQSKNTVVIYQEMAHETTNYSEPSDTAPRTIEKRNVERITRVSDDAIQYQLTSYDPGQFTAPYTREIIFDHTDSKIYEYACHEGNYGMENILRGHRAEERMAREAGATP